MIRASILIKSNDQRNYLERTFPMLSRQTEKNYEIIFLYSGTDESTIELAKSYGADVIKIKSNPHDYSHSQALNLGARHARGEVLVCLSADAVPANENWLASILRPLDEQQVAGVYGAHLAGTEANLLDRYRSRLWYGPIGNRQASGAIPGLSNANSAVRRSLWEKHNFDESLIQVEDYEWALWAQKNGYAVVYSPEAKVYHSHGKRYGIWRYLKRAIEFKLIRDSLDRRYGLPVVTPLPYYIGAALSLLIAAVICWLRSQSTISGTFALLLLTGPIALVLVAGMGFIQWLSER